MAAVEFEIEWNEEEILKPYKVVTDGYDNSDEDEDEDEDEDFE